MLKNLCPHPFVCDRLEEVDKFMPQEAKSLLKNVRKIAERDKRKKEEKRSQQLEIKNNNKSKGRVNRHKEYEDAFADSSDDEDEGPVTKSRKVCANEGNQSPFPLPLNRF